MRYAGRIRFHKILQAVGMIDDDVILVRGKGLPQRVHARLPNIMRHPDLANSGMFPIGNHGPPSRREAEEFVNREADAGEFRRTIREVASQPVLVIAEEIVSFSRAPAFHLPEEPPRFGHFVPEAKLFRPCGVFPVRADCPAICKISSHDEPPRSKSSSHQIDKGEGPPVVVRAMRIRHNQNLFETRVSEHIPP